MFLRRLVCTKFTMSGRMGALNTAGKVTFLPDDSPFSEYTDMSGRAHASGEKTDTQKPTLGPGTARHPATGAKTPLQGAPIPPASTQPAHRNPVEDLGPAPAIFTLDSSELPFLVSSGEVPLSGTNFLSAGPCYFLATTPSAAGWAYTAGFPWMPLPAPAGTPAPSGHAVHSSAIPTWPL